MSRSREGPYLDGNQEADEAAFLCELARANADDTAYLPFSPPIQGSRINPYARKPQSQGETESLRTKGCKLSVTRGCARRTARFNPIWANAISRPRTRSFLV